MLTVNEIIELLKQHDMQTDPLTIQRWIHEKKLVGVRTGNGDREWLIPEEEAGRIVRQLLDEENERLRKENEALTKDNERLKQMAEEIRRRLQDLPP